MRLGPAQGNIHECYMRPGPALERRGGAGGGGGSVAHNMNMDLVSVHVVGFHVQANRLTIHEEKMPTSGEGDDDRARPTVITQREYSSLDARRDALAKVSTSIRGLRRARASQREVRMRRGFPSMRDLQRVEAL